MVFDEDFTAAPSSIRQIVGKSSTKSVKHQGALENLNDGLLPENAGLGVSKESDAALITLWHQLMKEQQQLLVFIKTNENGAALKHVTIVKWFNLPKNQKSEVDDGSLRRRFNEKNIRLWCNTMTNEPYCFLSRTAKGPIRLSDRGRRVLELVKESPASQS